METYNIDAYVPSQMALRVEKAGIEKSSRDFFSTLTLSMMAGMFIGLGAVFYTYVIHDSALSAGLTKLIGGLVFSLGLILVIITGAELFTGNNLIVMAYVSRKITLGQLLRNWSIVFLGNFIGSMIVVALIAMSGQWSSAGAMVGAKALLIASGKVNLTFWQALAKGILCNILVCLAVYLCFSGRSVTDKILAILFPITAFVTLGFEHSVANMYFIPAGILLRGNSEVVLAAERILGSSVNLSGLTTYGFVVRNLVPVTIGNIIGGTIFVGIAHWFLFLRPAAAEPIRAIMTSGPPYVDPGTPVADIVKIMKQHKSSSVLIGAPGNALGIISEADVVRKVIASEREPAEVRAEEIMTSPLISVDIATSAYNVYRKMADNHIRHLMVTENGKQIGFVSVKDLIARPSF